jgi:hypothetical protein
MAYVLGFFAADGSMYRTGNGGYYIDFEITDFELLDAIRSTIGSQNKISIRRRMPERWKTIYRLQIGSSRLYGDLIALGFMPNKSLKMEFPAVPADYLPDFVRGYFDGDGCVHFGKYWRKDRQRLKLQLSVHFISGSKVFLEGLWSAVEPIIRGGHISIKERGYELVFGQWDSIALFHFMYDNGSELFLGRKYERFQRAFDELGMRA